MNPLEETQLTIPQRHVFTPRSDITIEELAHIFCLLDLGTYNIDSVPEELKRHFVPECE